MFWFFLVILLGMAVELWLGKRVHECFFLVVLGYHGIAMIMGIVELILLMDDPCPGGCFFAWECVFILAILHFIPWITIWWALLTRVDNKDCESVPHMILRQFLENLSCVASFSLGLWATVAQIGCKDYWQERNVTLWQCLVTECASFFVLAAILSVWATHQTSEVKK
jgi:hypothetical protein